MNGFIYKITNDVNNKVYIGKTLLNVEKRFTQHVNDSHRPRLEARPLYRAMRKYGTDKFHVELVEECPIDILSEREKYWINFYGSYQKGYNATLGGDGKQFYDYDAIVKGFLSGKYAYELAEEFGCCTETISHALHLAGIPTDINSRIRRRIQGKVLMKNEKGEILQEFESRHQAAEWIRENGYSPAISNLSVASSIGRALHGKRKTAYGFFWESVEALE